MSEKPAAQVTDEITDEFLNDPSSPIPDLSGNKSEDEDEDSDDLNSEDADSEDDPNKLWCICQQPHNNRFMICCDSCLDWYHGKCVGITKKMGKEMEEAGNEWACPKCKSKEEKESTNQLKDKLKERQQTKSTKVETGPSASSTNPTKVGDAKPKAKARRSLSKEKETVVEVKKVKAYLDFFEIHESSLEPQKMIILLFNRVNVAF